MSNLEGVVTNGYVHINSDVQSQLHLPDELAETVEKALACLDITQLAQGPEYVSLAIGSAIMEVATHEYIHHRMEDPDFTGAFWWLWLDGVEVGVCKGAILTDAHSPGDAYIHVADKMGHPLRDYDKVCIQGPYFHDHPGWNSIDPRDILNTLMDPDTLIANGLIELTHDEE